VVCTGLEEGSCVHQWIQHRPILGRRTTEDALHSITIDETWRQPGSVNQGCALVSVY